MDALDLALGNQNNLLLLEFEQAWTHYRHLEESRGKYLGFFFTVLIATLGFVLTIVKDMQNQKGPWLYFGILILIWIVNVFSFFIFSTIKKAGFVLRHYEDVIKRVRLIVYKENPNYFNEIMNVREVKHPVMNMTLFSTQKIAELIPAGAVLLLTIFHGASIYYLWNKEIVYHWQLLISLILLAGLWLLVLHAIVKITSFNIFSPSHKK